MRVIFLTHNYPRHPGDLPGAFLHPLAVALRAQGVDLRVVAPADVGRGGHEILDGVPVRRVRYAPAAWERLAYTGRLARAVRDPRGLLALAGLWRALRRGARAEAAGATGPVVVHAHWWLPAGLAAPPELPSVVTLHGTDAQMLRSRGIVRAVGRRVLRRASVVTAVSSSLARIAEEVTGQPLSEDQVQPMPLDASRYRRTSGGGGIVAVARLTEQKRLHLLIDAAARLAQPLPVTIAGDGPARLRLERHARNANLADRVTFAGQLPPEAVADLLAGADCFVLPAREEGYGLAAAEALLSGVPAVACRDGGGLLDIVPATGAGRIAEPTAESLAAAISSIQEDPAASDAAWATGTALRARLEPGSVARRARQWYARAGGSG